MNFAVGSKNALRARVDELLLGDLADEMATLGWSTFGVFAFSTSLVLDTNVEGSLSCVLIPLLADDQSRVRRLRRLHVQAFPVAAADSECHSSGRPEDIIGMRPAEEAARREALKRRLGG